MFALPTTAMRGRFAIIVSFLRNWRKAESMQGRVDVSTRTARLSAIGKRTCRSIPRRVQLLVFQGDTHVHTTKPHHCAADDDYQCHLLGFVGKYLQRSEELPFRTFLLGLRHRNFSHFSGACAHDGQHRTRFLQLPG